MTESNAPSEPGLYPSAFEQVNELLAQFAATVRVPPSLLDATGHAQLPYGDLQIGLNVHEERGVLLLLAEMGQLPEPPPTELLQHLLELNLISTGPCSFALDEDTGALLLRMMWPVNDLDFARFSQALQAVAEIGTDMRQRLAAQPERQ